MKVDRGIEEGDSIFEKYDLIDVDESFHIPSIPDEGLIFIHGSSGSGKSTILKKLFGIIHIEFDDKPIYLNFSSEEKAEELLIACGLRAVPAWKRKYCDLSNGERHRAYCAKSIDLGVEYIDEFTSVVDRDTARALSYAIQKYFRVSNLKRLVIASCHNDIIEWLNPDYIYDTDLAVWTEQSVNRRCLWRPKIELKIEAIDGSMFWNVFKKHHYLSTGFNRSSNAFGGFLNDRLVAFCSILRFPNGNFSNGWREHRTVVLPEFQGIGIGSRLSETIAQLVVDNGGRFFSKTIHPAFGLYRDKSSKWKRTSKNRKKRLDYKITRITKEDGHKMKHKERCCYSHEYLGDYLSSAELEELNNL